MDMVCMYDSVSQLPTSRYRLGWDLRVSVCLRRSVTDACPVRLLAGVVGPTGLSGLCGSVWVCPGPLPLKDRLQKCSQRAYVSCSGKDEATNEATTPKRKGRTTHRDTRKKSVAVG